MAIFEAYQSLDMILGIQVGTGVVTDNFDKRTNIMTTTETSSSGEVSITKYYMPGGDVDAGYHVQYEVQGRYLVKDYKLSRPEIWAIFQGQSFSDISGINWGDSSNAGRYLPGTDVEVLARRLYQNDTVTGSSGSDFLYSFRGDDLVNPGLGDDYVNGGTGIDIVRLSGKKSDYTLNRATDLSGIHYVTDYSNETPVPIYLATLDQSFKASGKDGNDTLVNVEKIRFDDGIYDITSGSFTEENSSTSSKPAKNKNKGKKNKTRK